MQAGGDALECADAVVCTQTPRYPRLTVPCRIQPWFLFEVRTNFSLPYAETRPHRTRTIQPIASALPTRSILPTTCEAAMAERIYSFSNLVEDIVVVPSHAAGTEYLLLLGPIDFANSCLAQYVTSM